MDEFARRIEDQIAAAEKRPMIPWRCQNCGREWEERCPDDKSLEWWEALGRPRMEPLFCEQCEES